MAATTNTADVDESALQAVAAAMRDAAKTASVHASEHAATLRQSAGEAGPKALEAFSRTVYAGSYVLAYGVVYATVFICQSLPQDNPLMRGLRDGGQAALNDLEAT